MPTAATSQPATAAGQVGGGHAGGEMRFLIPSDLLRGRAVQTAILDACEKAGFNDEAYFAVKLALDEAITNAIKHGNQLAADKQVEVRAAVDRESMWVEVRDEGPGFVRQTVPDPTADENLDKCSGRGLLLIEAYMTDVSWSADGRTIRMTKANTDAPPQIPGDD